MQGIINHTIKDLSFEEMQAILASAKAIEAAFGRKVFNVHLNAAEGGEDKTRMIAVAFVFDRWNSPISESEKLNFDEAKP